MRKNFSLLLCSALFFFGCVDTKPQKQKNLLGTITESQLKEEPYSRWYTKNYDEYAPSTEIIEKITPLLSDHNVTIFFGTWCGDSKEGVPQVLKILNKATIDTSRLHIIGLGGGKENYKKGPNGEEKGGNIFRVPTIIFKKDGVEKGRIIEFPVVSFEQDMLDILSEKEYFPNYRGAQTILQLINDGGFSVMSAELIANLLQPIIKRPSGLNSLGYSFLSSEKKEQAKKIFYINTLLFPKNGNVFDSYAECFFEEKEYDSAITYYQKAFSLDSTNENALKMIEKATNNIKKQHAL